MKLKFGDIAKDKITGFTGVVIARTMWINNCDRLTLQPREVKDGKPIACSSFDEPNLEFVESTEIKVFKVRRPEVPIELMDTVKDSLTNLTGVAVNRTEWLNGCTRVGVQPKELKDGIPVDYTVFDETDLILVERPEGTKPKPKTGGPRPEPRR